MIPDLLLALLGVSGDVFVPDVDSDGAETLVVAKDLDFIQPHERQRLNSLATLGASYAAIDRMARREQLSVSVSTSKTSLYRRALAIGLTEVLGSYEAKILKLEQDALRRGASGGTIGIAFGCIRRFSQHYQAPQAIEDEPGPSPLCGQAPETENGLFMQGQSVLRLDVKVRHVLDCLHSGDGVGGAVTAR